MEAILYKFCKSSSIIQEVSRHIVSLDSSAVPYSNTIFEDVAAVEEHSVELAYSVEYIIDFATSKSMCGTSERVVPNFGLDPDLDGLRQLYENLESILTAEAKYVATNELPVTMQDFPIAVEYIPQIGFAVVVDTREKKASGAMLQNTVPVARALRR